MSPEVSETPPSPSLRRPFGILAPFLLGVCLYLPSLAVGFLSDDFLYLAWAGDGPGTILGRLTVDSYPRMVRPLPGLVWWLGAALPTAGALVLHLLSALLHGAAAFLVTALGRRLGVAPPVALGVGLLFATFPLATEAVSWLSASFDLWATALALGALWVVSGDGADGRGKAIAASALFALALLSKESVLLLPVAVVLLHGRRRVGAGLWMGGVAVAYLLVRWSLLGGLGGYTDAAGRSLAASISPAHLVRTLTLQIPHRLLVPVKDPGALHLPVLLASAFLLGGLALALGVHRRPGRLAVAAGLFVVGVLPAAPILGVEWHHEGGRLLYFPVALLLVGLARAVDLRGPVRGRVAAGAFAGLVVLWTWAALDNQGSWRQAGRIAADGRQALASAPASWPAGATVLVDLPDTHRGAYVFRNGLAQAAARAGARSDLVFQRGTSAAVGPAEAPARLGRDLFVVAVDEDGRAVDLTACEARLWAQAGSLEDGTSVARTETGTFVTAGSVGDQPPPVVFLALEAPRSPVSGATGGSLHWRPDDEPFTVSRSLRIQVSPGGSPTPVRLPRDLPSGPLTIRWTPDAPAAVGSTLETWLVPRPPECLDPPRL